jgi:hypothetical protein
MDERMIMMLPGLRPTEIIFLKEMMRGLTESQKQQFLLFYSSKRREEQQLLILALIGFFGVAGIHRIVTGDVLLGVIYLFTFGFCGIGTIIDLINISRLSSNYNLLQAEEALRLTLAMNDQKGR